MIHTMPTLERPAAARAAPTVPGLLREWLATRLDGPAVAWLLEECDAIARGAPSRRLYMAFSGACRHEARIPLGLAEEEQAAADAARPGWMPQTWTRLDAARALLLLSRPSADRPAWLAELRTLFDHADLGELVSLHRALPVLPFPEEHVAVCAEGVRSNMTDVFRAVAHSNPFPAEHLPGPAWNQMVLKALFVDAGLAAVRGLDARGNPDLARMLCDYAHERWAAHRPVSPELWRCVGPHADAAGVRDLARAFDTGDAATRAAAAEALRRCPHADAGAVREARGIRANEGDVR